ncbi:hypothetical protein [Cellulosimicrobium sp. Marseille-Q4280]|uniref:hypothetical protein n=1 Tax=Cellulosimicrobium sp. Marseille-Q4280 TaxID=2937992 RepID=UPI00203A97D3|nr:hypothetical protein [Cellulosimicrobium sp. Marseille-Q4280]
MPHHHRSPDEYRRPDLALHLDRYCPPDREVFVAGTWHHQDALAHTAPGQRVALELVPEPGNRWDRWAVALDLDGARVGYLQGGSAMMWHDVVRAWNRNGYALYLAGEINGWSDGDSARRGVTLTGIGWSDVVALARAAGLDDDFDDLRQHLTPAERDGLTDDRGYTPAPATLRRLRDLREQFPQFTWQKKSGDLSAAERAPFWIGWFVRHELDAQRQHARLLARVLRLAKRRAKDLARAERERERTAYLAHGPRAVEMHRAGSSKAAIARALSITEHQVRKLLADEQPEGAASSTWHVAAQQERIAAARRALELQRSGMTRKQVAEAMDRSEQSVKELLSDAKFYQAPHESPDRLRLAEQCRQMREQGMGKGDVMAALGVSRPAGLRAFRDAAVLDALDAG